MIFLLACTGEPAPNTGDDFLAQVDFVVERGGIGPEEVSLDVGSIVDFAGEDRITWAARSDDGSSELLLVVEADEVVLARYRKGQQHILDAHATCTVERDGTELSAFECVDMHTEDGVLAPEDHEPWSLSGSFTGGAIYEGSRGQLIAGEGYSWGVEVEGRSMDVLAPWRADEWWVWHADDDGPADDVEFRVVPEAGRITITRLARDQVALETPVELALVGDSALSADYDGLVSEGVEIDVLLWEDLVSGEDDAEVVIQ